MYIYITRIIHKTKNVYLSAKYHCLIELTVQHIVASASNKTYPAVRHVWTSKGPEDNYELL